MTSQIKTFFLLAALTSIILFLGGMMGGRTGLIIAFGLAVFMNVGSYWYSDKIVLKMYKARQLSRNDAPQVFAMVEELAANAGIPAPRLFLVDQDSPNAFATGRNPENAVVAVTSGIMRVLTPEELRGVLAHEIGHITNHDILIQSVAAVLAGAIMMVASMLKWGALFGFGGRDEDGPSPLVVIGLAIIAPIAATVIQMAISRSREYLADATGARISHSPKSLASALYKLDAAARNIPMDANPATENMFIINPFNGASMSKWFSTHPSTEERIAKLMEMDRNL
ncbi:zinc metalloprotease HtpX [Desulfovibrio gilichinskyi]|uniref:Protease HtpX homolog n=1 Tax=Desulfovibrio gilichinskyi TaxID=1519643 RepID=A0A1X7EMU8_9BACT|nr:zinc metalloprotease HtpX [Desulfovibrio gilichinskyi]SMF36880.1 heat shock protein HtpX [Desulfovibrio gilichinskyi]